MRAIVSVVFGVCLAAVLFYGCSPGGSNQGPASNAKPVVPGAEVPDQSVSADQLIAQWKELANKATRDNPMVVETEEVANDIAVRDPQSLLTLLDLVKDPQSSPHVKVLATLSLTPVVGAHIAPQLIEMTKAEYDGTTRACATNMLRLIPTDEVTVVLRQLKNDTEPRVKLYAQLGMGTRDPQERKELYALWNSAQTGVQEKGAVIDALAHEPVVEDLPVLQEAASDATTNEDTRVVAIGALGRIGDNDQLATLEAWAEKDPSEKVREIAKASADELKNRKSGQGQMVIPLQ